MGQGAVGETDRFESDHTHMKNDAQATIAAWLWKYYEYGLPDTPGRIAKGIVQELQSQGFVIIESSNPDGAIARESLGGNNGRPERNAQCDH